MNRLAKRVQKLEGGTSTGIDIVAKVPYVWSKERQGAEVEAIAMANGAKPPFGLVVLLQEFSAGEDDDAEIIAMGGWRAGHGNQDKPLTGNMQKDRANGQA